MIVVAKFSGSQTEPTICRCCTCDTPEHVIKFGKDVHHTTSFALCDDCLDALTLSLIARRKAYIEGRGQE